MPPCSHARRRRTPHMSDDLTRFTISEAAALLRQKQVSSVELTRAAFDRIRAAEDRIHAFITLTEERALQQAQRADDMLAKGVATPLTGIPAAIKDVISTSGVRT